MASRAVTARSPSGTAVLWRSTTRFARTWPYLLPALFFFVGWQLLPIVRAAWISFTSFSFLLDDSPESATVGLVRQLRRRGPGPAREGGAPEGRDLHGRLPARNDLPPDGDRGARRPCREPAARGDLPGHPARPGDDPGPAHLHPLGVDVLERDRPDQLRPRRRPGRLRPREPADVARLHQPHLPVAGDDGVVVGPRLPHDVLPRRPLDDPEGAVRVRARRRRERVAHLLEDHVRAAAADPARAGRAPLRNGLRADRRVHPHGRASIARSRPTRGRCTCGTRRSRSAIRTADTRPRWAGSARSGCSSSCSGSSTPSGTGTRRGDPSRDRDDRDDTSAAGAARVRVRGARS